MKTLLSITLILAFVLGVLGGTCKDPRYLPVNLSDPVIVEALSDLNKLFSSRAGSVPSFSLAINYGDQQIFTYSAGSNLTSNYTIDSHTIYRIGSVTKVFTTLLSLLAFEGDLDSPLSFLVPELKSDPKCFDKIRLRDVLSHLAGLPRESPCGLYGCPISNKDAIAYLRALCKNDLFIAPPGALPSYSNFGFSIVGRLVVERAFNSSWENLVAKKIIGPLELEDTAPTWSYLSPTAQARAVPGFTGTTPVPLPGVNLGWDNPAGEMWSSASDLAKLMSNIIEVGFYRMAGSEPSPDLLGLKHAAVRRWLNEMEYINNDGSGWGLPWEESQKFTPNGNWRILAKGGSLPGYLAHIASVPQIRLSFSLLVNGAADLGGWRDDAFDIIVPALYKVIAQADGYVAEAPIPPNPSRYLGSYKIPGFDTYSLTIKQAPVINILVLAAQIGPQLTTFLIRESQGGKDPTKLQVGSTYSGTDCMSSQTLGFENQFLIFTFANQSDPNSPATSVSIPGVIYGLIFPRQNN